MAATINTVITFNPRSVSATTTLLDLVRMLEQSGFHHLPVTDAEKNLLGVISDKDIIESLAQIREQSNSDRDASQRAEQLRAFELMSRHPLTIDPRRCEPTVALQTLLQNHVHSLPAVEDGRLVGMITSTDFLREFTYGEVVSFRDPVGDHCDRRWETVEATDDLSVGDRLLRNNCVDCLIVEQGGLPLASLTERDFRAVRLRATAADFIAGQRTDALTFGRLIAGAPTIRPGDTLGDAANRMLDAKRRSVAVIAQSGRVHGVVREERVLEVMLARLED
ncbi:MAG: CBS domain-containing protein [Pirellulaceae bacterium]|jgi:CBS domain-containing protein|nr:CBS domain-containing protein [Pirellulaceae bacterium]MDP7019736.1 CBS domain-containing protein [Pirellulaceae bacterium]